MAGWGRGEYFGQWSEETNLPHGKGVFVDIYGWIHIQHFKHGTWMADGKFIFINTKSKMFMVGTRVMKDGKRHDHATMYTEDGKSESGLWIEWEKQK